MLIGIHSEKSVCAIKMFGQYSSSRLSHTTHIVYLCHRGTYWKLLWPWYALFYDQFWQPDFQILIWKTQQIQIEAFKWSSGPAPVNSDEFSGSDYIVYPLMSTSADKLFHSKIGNLNLSAKAILRQSISLLITYLVLERGGALWVKDKLSKE